MQELYHIKVKPGQLGRYCFLPGDPGRCEKIAARFENPEFVSQNREYTIYQGTLAGAPVSVCSTGIGGPSAAIAVEELHMAGADTFIRIGTCGGMSLDCKSADVVIAQAAVRQDGCSKEYLPVEFPAAADFFVTAKLWEAAARLDCPAHIGIVQSKDSFYGQHAAGRMPVKAELEYKWEAWRLGGALASEMEAATVFTVARTLGCRAGAALSCLWNQEREKAGLDSLRAMGAERAIDVAVEAMRLLIEEER